MDYKEIVKFLESQYPNFPNSYFIEVLCECNNFEIFKYYIDKFTNVDNYENIYGDLLTELFDNEKYIFMEYFFDKLDKYMFNNLINDNYLYIHIYEILPHDKNNNFDINSIDLFSKLCEHCYDYNNRYVDDIKYICENYEINREIFNQAYENSNDCVQEILSQYKSKKMKSSKKLIN